MLVLGFLAASISTSQALNLFGKEEEFLPVDEAFRLTSQQVGNQVVLYWEIAEDYYLYRDKMSVTPKQATIEPANFPKGTPKQDEYFGLVQVYTQLVDVPITVKQADESFELEVRYQGCTEGLCYAPQTKKLSFSRPAQVPALGKITQTLATTSSAGAEPSIAPKLLKKTTTPASANKEEKVDFLKVDEAFKPTVTHKDGILNLHWEIADTYYLYQHRFRFELTGSEHEPIKLPPGIETTDEYLGDVTVYKKSFSIPIKLVPPSKDQLSLSVGFQGCTDGLCYAPTTRVINIDTNSTLPQGVVKENETVSEPEKSETKNEGNKATTAIFESETARLQRILAEGDLWLIVSLFFGAGLLLSLNPCVYPMYPVLSSIILGQGDKPSMGRSFLLSFAYVQGIAFSYAALGILIGSLGLGSGFFQQPIFLIIAIVIMILLALAMFGYFELQLPSSMRDRLHNISHKQQGGTYLGVFVMGALSTIILSPCTAPPLFAAFGYIGQSGDAMLGGLSLYALGMGFGCVLMAISITGGKLLPKAGTWMNAIKTGFGVAILAVAISLTETLIPGQVYLMLWAALFITTALHMGLFSGDKSFSTPTFWRGIAHLLFVYGILLVIGAALGNAKMTKPLEGLSLSKNAQASQSQQKPFLKVSSVDEIEKAIQSASASGKSVMIDFMADWCTACFELAEYTFPDPAVQRAFANTVLLKVNLTEENAINREIQKAYDVVGYPLLRFYDSSGQELPQYRVAGFMKAADFAKHVNAAFNQ